MGEIILNPNKYYGIMLDGCTKNMMEFIRYRRVPWSPFMVIILVMLCGVTLARDHSESFSDGLETILNSPSQHGQQVAKWEPGRPIRRRRNLDETFHPDGAGGGFYDSDFGDDCMKYGDDDLSTLFQDLYKGPVCNIIDARWNADQMKDLENCVIVNGFVQLVFMPYLTDAELEKYRFPKLRVITHYLLIFRMYNLRTLRYMFPNLAVIAGQVLFKDYSLVIYENPHLQEIGLGNLQFINNGAVRIERNSNLCYLNTIDWQRLGSYTGNTLKKNVMLENRDPGLCVDHCGDSKKCQKDGIREYCWGLDLCQKGKSCPERCPHSCYKGRCECHEECLAGCTRPNDATACIACRNKYNNSRCVKDCPKGMYLIHDWLCITKEKCQRLDWHFHGDVCKLQCPSGYQAVVKDCMRVCEKCDFDCGEVCGGNRLLADHYSLQKVSTCKEIEGSLTININGGSDVVDELDEAFKDLEVVGSLFVRSSYPLVSLSFLKNLRLIRGNKMKEGYSVHVLGNQNLKELWDFKKSNLTIAQGKSFFHFNPHLCLQEIYKVSALTKPIEDDKDISETTNGDRAVCEIEELNITNVDINQFDEPFVKIIWENAFFKDRRTLIGYQVLYKESPEKNAKKLEGVDACGHTSWTIVDKPKSDEVPKTNLNITDLEQPSEPEYSYKILTNLKAYTRYAFYVHAYTTSTAKKGAESEIHYFQTRPAEPSKPQALLAKAIDTSSIEVTWERPTSPNGIITHYIIEWRRQQEEDLMSVRAVNTCDLAAFHSKPLIPEKTDEKDPEVADPKKDEDSNQKNEPSQGECKCDCEEKTISKQDEQEARDTQEFENFLQDELFFPIVDEDFSDFEEGIGLDQYNESVLDPYDMQAKRFRRSFATLPPGLKTSATTAYPPRTAGSMTTIPATITTVRPENPRFALKRMVVYKTNAVISGLHHFSEYDIMVYACNHASDPASKTDMNFEVRREAIGNYTKCSIEALTTKRTAPNVSADVIPPGSLNATTKLATGDSEEVTELVWKMPLDPNAYIRTFTVEINSTDAGTPRKLDRCVHVNASVQDVISYSIHSSRLAAGSYTARVRPISLAGEGNWSEPVAFEVTDLNGSSTSVIVIVPTILAVLIVSAMGVAVYFFTRKKTVDQSQIYTDFNPEYSRYVYIPDEYEISLENVSILEEIGHGNFGKVFAGLAKSVVKGQDETKVAIKKLHENAMPARRFEFLKEASMMKAFNAHHVVRLLGVVSKTVDPMVIMEFMEKGDLKTYLRSRREGSEENTQDLPAPTVPEKLQMAAEIADGMAYLADNKFVHRDLAARNCLVNSYGTVKIGDFGLTRDIYETDYYRKESRGFLPIRWMAPESLKDGIFDSRSDVWSYGVVLWELATLAEQPYQGQQHDEVTRFVIDGGYMERPRDCPRKLYELMTTCWQYNPKMRPIFLEIVQELYFDVNEEFKEVCFYGKSQDATTTNGDHGVQFPLPPEHSSGTDLFPPHDVHSPNKPQNENINLGPYWHMGDHGVRYTNNGAGHLSGTPPHAESDEKQGLLQPDPDQSTPAQGDRPCPHSGDSRSPNTTSTTALSPSLSGEEKNPKGHQRHDSDSSYENDYDDELEVPTVPMKDPNLGDSGTFMVVKSEATDPLISYTHLNGGHKRSSNLEIDLESGVEDGNWANSSTNTSASNPTTPTETQAMLGPTKSNRKEGNKLFQMLRPPGPTSC